jgi:hypothetical protein
MLASAIAAVVVGVATSFLAVEQNSKIISVTPLARHPFWSARPSWAIRIDVSLLTYKCCELRRCLLPR